MKLEDLNEVQRLQRELSDADACLNAFEHAPGAMLPVRVFTEERGWGADMPPVAKSIGISAARLAREKIVAALRELGVRVD